MYKKAHAAIRSDPESKPKPQKEVKVKRSEFTLRYLVRAVKVNTLNVKTIYFIEYKTRNYRKVHWTLQA